MCINRLRPCLHRSVLICLTCRAHSGRGLSTQMISFLQCGRKGKNREQKTWIWLKRNKNDFTTTLNRLDNSCQYIKFNYAVYKCAAASVLILQEKRNIHTVKWKFTALLLVKKFFYFFIFFCQRHPGAYHGCLPACALICSYESAAWNRRRPIPFLSSLCQAPYSCGARAQPVSPATNQINSVPEQETWHSLRSMYTSWFLSLSLLFQITHFISTRSLLIRLHNHCIHIMLTGNPYSCIVTNECGSVMLNIGIANCIS